MADQATLPCTRCGATDQRLAAVRYGAAHHRSSVSFRCLDTAGCDARWAARDAAWRSAPVMTSAERRADTRARWEAKKLANGWA